MMAKIIESFQRMNMKGRIGVVIGIVASISTLVLFIIMNFFNPYTSTSPNDVLLSTFCGLGLPAILALVAALDRKAWLMYVVFIGSLPLSFYLAGTPSIFRYFILFSLGYLIAAIFLTIDRKKEVT